MNKKERSNAVLNLKEPDRIPANPHVMAQSIYDIGWSLAEITTQIKLNIDKVAKAFVANTKNLEIISGLLLRRVLG